jgi:PAS domain S-box-containing protein
MGLVHPDDRDRLERIMHESLERTHVWDTAFRVISPDGSLRWLLAKGTVLLDASGKSSRLVGVNLDITESKQAEAAMHESEERFRVFFFQAAVGIAQTSLNGQWLLLNPRFCEMVGYSDDELRGKTFIDITHSDDREASLRAQRKLLAGEISTWSSEKRYIRKDGITLWARVFVSLVRDEQNEAQYFVSVVEDITERIQAERALQQSRQELRALAGRLIDAEETERKRIARELRDDLNQKLALLAFDAGSLVLVPPPSADQTSEKFRDLQTRVVQLSQDVRQISHRLHPSILEDLGLTAALGELCEELSAREGIAVVFEQEAVPEALPVDVASCLYRVSQAALHNVIKHSRANRAQLKLSGSPEGIQLRIHDTGVGFDSESASPRNGIGIVSMKERVLLVQGEFSIRSQPGQGTTVEVFVPLSKEAI